MRGKDLWVANAGDSRCVASRRGRALALTHDHKPTDQVEMQRIAKVSPLASPFLSALASYDLLCHRLCALVPRLPFQGWISISLVVIDVGVRIQAIKVVRAVQAGGFVAEGRINGSLNLSRALGDMDYKQSKDMGPSAQVMPVSRYQSCIRPSVDAHPGTVKVQHPCCSVCGRALRIGGAVALLLALLTQQSCARAQMVIAVPEVRHLQLEDGDEFLILACDGIWDVLSNQEVTLLPSTPSYVSCRHMCSLVPAMSGRSSGTNAHSSTHWRALCASEVI